jgi:uncharacterized phiE125 gp8 family phage protein
MSHPYYYPVDTSEPELVEDVDPAEEPVTVNEARAQCEDDAYEDSDVDPVRDAQYAIWIAAAREHCENFLGLTLAPKVFSVGFASFPSGSTVPPPPFAAWPFYSRRYPCPTYFELPKGPVRWVEMDYGDESDALTLLSGTNFRIDGSHKPNRLYPIGSWPSIDGDQEPAVRIRYGAGFGVNTDASLPIPAAAKMAILGLVAYFFENRGNTTQSELLELPKFVEALLRPLRVRLGMA